MVRLAHLTGSRREGVAAGGPPGREPVNPRKVQRGFVQRYARGHPSGPRAAPPPGVSRRLFVCLSLRLGVRRATLPRRRHSCAAALARAPPRGPVAAASASPRPAPLRRGTCAPGPLRWPGRRRAAVMSGPGLRRSGPPAVGRRSALPVSARVRPSSALLGRGSPPCPCRAAP